MGSTTSSAPPGIGGTAGAPKASVHGRSRSFDVAFARSLDVSSGSATPLTNTLALCRPKVPLLPVECGSHRDFRGVDRGSGRTERATPLPTQDARGAGPSICEGRAQTPRDPDRGDLCRTAQRPGTVLYRSWRVQSKR